MLPKVLDIAKNLATIAVTIKMMIIVYLAHICLLGSRTEQSIPQPIERN